GAHSRRDPTLVADANDLRDLKEAFIRSEIAVVPLWAEYPSYNYVGGSPRATRRTISRNLSVFELGRVDAPPLRAAFRRESSRLEVVKVCAAIDVAGSGSGSTAGQRGQTKDCQIQVRSHMRPNA